LMEISYLFETRSRMRPIAFFAPPRCPSSNANPALRPSALKLRGFAEHRRHLPPPGALLASGAIEPIVMGTPSIGALPMSTVLSAPPPASGLADIMATMPAYGSEFAKTYANHAPMVLVALDRLGGSPERL